MSSSAKIEELRKKFDENPRRYFAPLANEYRKAGDFDQAIFICQEYLPQQPGHMSGHIVFGQALFEAKRFPEAKAVFETALSLDPENLIALRHLADISRDLGDTAAARTWYERVLHADPRNEEIAAIMETLGTGAAAAAAPTAEAPAVQAPPPAAAVPTPPARKFPDPSSAPTVVLTAAAVQEMVKARQATKIPPPAPESAPEVELLTLDSASTVEIRLVDDPAPLEGLEPTSQAAPATLEGLEPTSQAAPMEMPAFEPLGLESNMAPGQQADAAAAPPPLDGLDTISLEMTMPGDAPPTSAVAPTMEMPAVRIPESDPATVADDGLLDLESFSIGGEAAARGATPLTAETPVGGANEADAGLLDFDLPAPPEAAAVPPMEVADAPSSNEEITMPTMIIEAVKAVAPTMMDFVETAVPSMLDAVTTIVPAVVGLVAETPTVVMEAIRVESPAVAEPERPPRTSQSVPFVTETMAQLYLSQGHRAEAIDIYRKLIEARPGDAELKAKLAAVEAEERRPVPAADRAPAPAEKRFTGSGPSIRTVLRELFGVDGSQLMSATSPSGTLGEVGSIDMLFGSESVGGSLTALAVAFDGGYVAAQGNIDELFGGGGR